MTDVYMLASDGSKQDWNGNTWVPKYIDVTPWYTLKILNNKITSIYIHGVRSENNWVSDY